MNPRAVCLVRASESVELYFYGELAAPARVSFERHLAGCAACRDALDELALIRSALAARPPVGAPPSGDWRGFMARLNAAVAAERVPVTLPGRAHLPWLAMAALLALVTMSILFAARARPVVQEEMAIPRTTSPGAAGSDAALAAVGQQHLERSKLVLLGLTGRDAERTDPSEWHYERELASRLLDDTRLYRLAAEQSGLSVLADVMRDLEFVLLQASMTEGRDGAALSRLQRAIHKRDLLQKVDVVRAGI